MPSLSFSFLLLLLFGYAVVTVSAGSIVESLPGYGNLLFKLETGYIGVGENEEVQLFYYFVESKNESNPLLLWIPAGPGCSSIAAFFFSIGPLLIDTENYQEGSLPTLLPNDYTWAEDFNIIFLDAPVGVGFSYSTTPEGYYSSDTIYAEHIYEFIQKWLKENQKFSNSFLYFGGEGYTNIIPLAIQKIFDGNGGDEPFIDIKGYAMGNPGTDLTIDFNSRVPFVHRLALISDELFEEANTACNGTFFPEPDDGSKCHVALKAIDKLLCAIDPNQILDPSCSNCTDSIQTHSAFDCSHSIISLPRSTRKQCSTYYQSVTEAWVRDADVQEALHIRQGTITEWEYCNNTLNDDTIYDKNVSSVVDLHQKFTKTNIQGLIYSGDHDWSIPYIGTQKWIKSLNLPLVDDWRAWFVDNEVAGYTRKYEQDNFSLTFATVKGAGHFAAEFRPQCSTMINRWMASKPI